MKIYLQHNDPSRFDAFHLFDVGFFINFTSRIMAWSVQRLNVAQSYSVRRASYNFEMRLWLLG